MCTNYKVLLLINFCKVLILLYVFSNIVKLIKRNVTYIFNYTPCHYYCRHYILNPLHTSPVFFPCILEGLPSLVSEVGNYPSRLRWNVNGTSSVVHVAFTIYHFKLWFKSWEFVYFEPTIWQVDKTYPAITIQSRRLRDTLRCTK